MDSGIFGSFLDGALFDEHEIEIKIMHHRVIVVSLNIPVEHFQKTVVSQLISKLIII